MSRKEQILETALEMFNESGYMEVGVREIARRLEISPGNLSYHFKKKEDILLALLSTFSERNSGLYEEYNRGQPNLRRFMELMRSIFDSQFDFRGVYIGNQVVQAELQSQDRFNYRAVAARRIESFREIYYKLCDAGQLDVGEEDVDFLVSYITLFGRFWITEAMLNDRQPDRTAVVSHYLSLLARQLSLFATEAGRESLLAFERG